MGGQVQHKLMYATLTQYVAMLIMRRIRSNKKGVGETDRQRLHRLASLLGIPALQ